MTPADLIARQFCENSARVSRVILGIEADPAEGEAAK